MIISRAECRAIHAYMSKDEAIEYARGLGHNAEAEMLVALFRRIDDEAGKPDEPSVQLGWIRGADGITRKIDATIRVGDRVMQSNRPGKINRKLTGDLFNPETVIYGEVKSLTHARARVLFEQCDAIPVDDYAQWVPLSELRKAPKI